MVEEKCLRDNADFLVEEIRDHIDKNDLGWTPNAPYTIAKKGHDKVYVEHGDLRESFDYEFHRKNANRAFVFVGAGDGEEESGKTFAQVMEENEYGTFNVPARPLINPTYQIAKKELIANVKDAFQDFFDHGCTF